MYLYSRLYNTEGYILTPHMWRYIAFQSNSFKVPYLKHRFCSKFNSLVYYDPVFEPHYLTDLGLVRGGTLSQINSIRIDKKQHSCEKYHGISLPWYS